MGALLDMVAASVELRRKGNAYWGVCPFHQPDKTGSFKVEMWRGKELFYCFGCSAHGEAVNWLMLTKKISFREAKRILGEERVRPDPAIIEARRQEAWRKHAISLFRDQHPDCVCPDWLLEIEPAPRYWKPPRRTTPRQFTDEEFERIYAAIWEAA